VDRAIALYLAVKAVRLLAEMQEEPHQTAVYNKI
jgi:hypothetical protein